jgi:hypothetical protein
MSAAETPIRAALVTYLQTLASLPPVAWENVPYTPTIGTMFIRPVLLPAETFQAEIGTLGQNEHTGIYQISIFSPIGIGTLTAYTLRDALINHFKRGTTLVYSGVTTKILKCYCNSDIQETDWLHIPVNIRYSAKAAN